MHSKRRIKTILKLCWLVDIYCSLGMCIFVYIPQIFFKLNAFKDSFKPKFLIYSSITGLFIYSIVFIFSFIQLLIHVQTAKRDGVCNINGIQNNQKRCTYNVERLKYILPYLIFISILIFHISQILSLISLFYDFGFNNISNIFKIRINSIIDLIGYSLILLTSIISLLIVVNNYISTKGSDSRYAVGCKEKDITKYKRVLIYISVLSLSITMIGVISKLISAIEAIGKFLLLDQYGIGIPVAIYLKLIAKLSPFLVILISSLVELQFSKMPNDSYDIQHTSDCIYTKLNDSDVSAPCINLQEKDYLIEHYNDTL